MQLQENPLAKPKYLKNNPLLGILFHELGLDHWALFQNQWQNHPLWPCHHVQDHNQRSTTVLRSPSFLDKIDYPKLKRVKWLQITSSHPGKVESFEEHH